MRKIFLIVAVVLAMSSSAFAADRKLVARYMEVVPVKNVVAATLQKLIPGDERRVGAIIGRMNFGDINKALAEKISKNFTDKELKSAIAYYSSKEGKSLNRKMPLVVDSIAPLLQAELQRSLAADPAFRK